MRLPVYALPLAFSLLGACHDLSDIAKPAQTPVRPIDVEPSDGGRGGAGGSSATPPAPSAPDASDAQILDVAEVAPDLAMACTSGESLVQGVCTPIPPSCRSLAPTCGPEGNDSCCGSDLIPGGQFSRGFDRSNTSTQDGEDVTGWQSQEAAKAFVTPYQLDRYEVTVGRFRQFLAAFDAWSANNPENMAGRHPMIVGSGWRSEWTKKADRYGQSALAIRNLIKAHCPTAGSPNGSRVLDALADSTSVDDNRPMPCVSWHEAMLFCIWDRGRLPTEAEWNYAATGGEQQNAFPWGSSETAADAKSRANIDRGSDDFLLTAKVGTFGMKKGVSRFGQYDMAGNVFEWVADTCEDCKTYTQQGATNPFEANQSNPIVRGGSFKYTAARARTAFRLAAGYTTDFRYIDLGWRCARNP